MAQVFWLRTGIVAIGSVPVLSRNGAALLTIVRPVNAYGRRDDDYFWSMSTMMWESLLAQAHANREQAHANRLTAEAMQKAWATLAMPQEPDQLDCWFAAGQLANDGAKLAAQLDEPPPSTPCQGARVAGNALLETPPKQWASVQVQAHPGLPPEWPAVKAATAETFAAKQDGFEKRKEEAAVENEHGTYHTPAPSPSALASVPSPTAPAPPNVVSAPAPSHHLQDISVLVRPLGGGEEAGVKPGGMGATTASQSRPIMGCDRKTSNCSRKERQRRHEQSCRDKDKAKQQSDDGDSSQHSSVGRTGQLVVNPESSAESCDEAAEGSATDGVSQEGSASGAVAIYRRVGWVTRERNPGRFQVSCS